MIDFNRQQSIATANMEDGSKSSAHSLDTLLADTPAVSSHPGCIVGALAADAELPRDGPGQAVGILHAALIHSGGSCHVGS
jgi:hypothetical protein